MYLKKPGPEYIKQIFRVFSMDKNLTFKLCIQFLSTLKVSSTWPRYLQRAQQSRSNDKIRLIQHCGHNLCELEELFRSESRQGRVGEAIRSSKVVVESGSEIA